MPEFVRDKTVRLLGGREDRARVGLRRGQTLPGVFDQPGALGNEPRREGSESLHRRGSDIEWQVAQPAGLPTCGAVVTPPDTMYAITSGASASILATRDAGTTMT